jgi:hypothetical protein
MGNVGIFHPVVLFALLTFVGLLPRSGSDLAALAGFTHELGHALLFHVVCIVLFVTGGASYLTIALAWVFVVAWFVWGVLYRASAGVRQAVFVVANVALLALWIVLAIHLLQVPTV